MKVTGKITKILDTEAGKSKEGKDWKKVKFIVETNEQYNNLYCFEVFGLEKVSEFLKYRKVGDTVDVDFNVQTNEWKGNYYTSLQAWKIWGTEAVPKPMPAPDLTAQPKDDLPF